jgi:hypothetical protein
MMIILRSRLLKPDWPASKIPINDICWTFMCIIKLILAIIDRADNKYYSSVWLIAQDQ